MAMLTAMLPTTTANGWWWTAARLGWTTLDCRLLQELGQRLRGWRVWQLPPSGSLAAPWWSNHTSAVCPTSGVPCVLRAGCLRHQACSSSVSPSLPVHPAWQLEHHSGLVWPWTETHSPTSRAMRSPAPGGRECSGLRPRAPSKSAQVGLMVALQGFHLGPCGIAGTDNASSLWGGLSVRGICTNP